MLTPFGSSGPLIRAGDRQGWLRFIGAHMAGGGGGFRLTAEGKPPGAATVPLRGPTSSVAPSLSTAWCPRPCHRSCSGKWEAHTGCLSDQKTLPMGCSVRTLYFFRIQNTCRCSTFWYSPLKKNSKLVNKSISKCCWFGAFPGAFGLGRAQPQRRGTSP